MTPLAWMILIIVLLDTLLQMVARQLNRTTLAQPLPEAFVEVYSPEEYLKNTSYAAEGMGLAQWEELTNITLFIGFWLAGGFAELDFRVQSMAHHPVLAGLLFFGILALAKSILGLPFSIYATFSIETRYKFNRTTVGTFFLDLLKGLALSLVLGGALGGAGLWALYRFGPEYWWLCWLIWLGFSGALLYLAPRWLLPLFNTFKPLAEGELKQHIEAYARTIDFPLRQILVMDGSRRSSKSNAFFTGFGKHRRIVLFDTLIEKHALPELMAILAHEMGHYKLRHTLKTMVISSGYSGMLLFAMAIGLEWSPLSAAFGLEPSLHAGLLGVMILFTPLNRLFSIAMNAYSRKNEFAADRFAAETTPEPQAMVAALIRLSRDNFSHLNPHPLWIWLTYSHPPVLERIQALEFGFQTSRNSVSMSYSGLDSE